MIAWHQWTTDNRSMAKTLELLQSCTKPSDMGGISFAGQKLNVVKWLQTKMQHHKQT